MKKFFALLTLAVVGLAAFKTGSNGYKIGDVAADFNLKNVDGKMVSLANYKAAKGFIVVFTCNHCPYAKAYESRIMDLDKKYASKGYPVIAISPNDPVGEPQDSFDNMKKLAMAKHYTFPYTIDETQDVTREYGAKSTPDAFILQKTDKGNVVKYMGAIDDDTENSNSSHTRYVENAINALLSGKSVTTTSTKAIGCCIKWKRGA
jgi:peroxiredoxin